MKVLPALLLAALMLPLVPSVVAQEPVSTHLADDSPGDVRVAAQGQGTAPPADAFAPADLKALDAAETPDDLAFTVSVASLAPQAEAVFEGNTLYTIDFLQHDRMYRVRIMRQVSFTTSYAARLEGFDPGRGGYFALLPLEVQVAPEAGQLSVTVPRQALTDANGSAPHPEFPVTGFHAMARGLVLPRRNAKIGVTVEAAATVSDAMPDSGNATTALPIHFGVRQRGMARLSSEIPTRASNGEATTFVFQVDAANLGVSPDTYTLATTAIPSGWTVKLPSSQVTIPGNSSIRLPILVTTPFTHTHGSFQNFVLRMASANHAGDEGAVQLGVRYMQPPQPAGHHSQLWFHSEPEDTDPVVAAATAAFGVGGSVWMNALDADPTDKAADVPGENAGVAVNGTAPRQAYAWEVPLAPGLEMGLDFDLSRRGTLQANVKSPAPGFGAILAGSLVHYGKPAGLPGPGQPARGRMTVLADLVPTAPVDLQAGATAILASDLVPRPEADFVPFEQGASLVLALNLTFGRPDPPFGPQAPAIAPGSTLTLPLFEYHDPVNDIFVSDVELVVTSAQDRFANPGGSVLFNLSLENRGAAEATYLLEFVGTNAAWARLIPAAPSVAVPAGGSYLFSIAVHVPEDVQVPTDPAAAKPSADLVVSATNQADPNQRALARLFTTVDLAPRPDDSDLVARLDAAHAYHETPGVPIALAAAAVAVALLASRRRRLA